MPHANVMHEIRVYVVQFARMPTMRSSLSELEFNAHNDFVKFIQKTKTKCSKREMRHYIIIIHMNCIRHEHMRRHPIHFSN